MNESWIQIISLFIANAALIVWFRTESRNDWRHMDTKLEEYKKESNQILIEIKKEIKEFQLAMREETRNFQIVMMQESRDFHGKLERQDAEFKAHMMYEHKK